MDPAEVIAKSLPFDAETEALLEKILLGQERAALYELIGRVAARAITEFGRSSLSDLLQRPLPSGGCSTTRCHSVAGSPARKRVLLTFGLESCHSPVTGVLCCSIVCVLTKSRIDD